MLFLEEYVVRRKNEDCLNEFDINSLYRKMPKKPFIKGRKQEFEVLMMYYWLHGIDSDDYYWDEYLDKVLPALNQK